MISWSALIGPAQRRFRAARIDKIRAEFPDLVGATIIDIGGSIPFWRMAAPVLQPKSVKIYNIHHHRMVMGDELTDRRIELFLYDGVTIPEADGSADLVICNSVIEHVPPAARAGLAREIERVGKAYVVQTPSPVFPLELHFGLPFLHWLPRKMGRALSKVSPFHFLSGADGPTYFDETRLLSHKELRQLLPQAKIVTERLAGIPKSYLAIGRTA